MQTIGKRLEEARKRKGISIREASEATKIRSDFLKNFELDQFDFDLPEIYKRGFVKIYANYLKLDTKSILTDYSAQQITSEHNKSTGSSELFGSMDANPAPEETSKPLLGKLSAKPQSNNTSEDASQVATQITEIDKALYVKLGLVAIGVLAFLFVVIKLIVSVLGGSDKPEANVADSGNNPSAESTTTPDAPASGPETTTLIASGDVYVLVKQRNDNKELVNKTLSSGEKLNFIKEGPIDIFFTAGENLVIVNSAGIRLRPEREGTAKISIP